jgi:hypothetical protein
MASATPRCVVTGAWLGRDGSFTCLIGISTGFAGGREPRVKNDRDLCKDSSKLPTVNHDSVAALLAANSTFTEPFSSLTKG